MLERNRYICYIIHNYLCYLGADVSNPVHYDREKRVVIDDNIA